MQRESEWSLRSVSQLGRTLKSEPSCRGDERRLLTLLAYVRVTSDLYVSVRYTVHHTRPCPFVADNKLLFEIFRKCTRATL